MKTTLWTKNFTIITFGTLCSMCGVAVLSFASGLLILDTTGSTFLYALFLVLVNLPAVLVPLFVGPFLDRFSRRNLIIFLDYFSSVLVAAAAVIVHFDLLPSSAYFVFGGIFGAIGGAYNVTYESFYPTLIPVGMGGKAYSVSSLLFPIANTLLLPLSAFIYDFIGLPILFAFTSIMYFVAATFETQIKVEEAHLLTRSVDKYKLKQYFADFKEGVKYLKNDKGLLSITVLFFVIFFADSVLSTLLLPYYKATEGLGVQKYSFISGISTVGRVIGGLYIFNHKFKSDNRFRIALAVYLTISVLQGAFLFFGFWPMLVLYFLLGLFSVMSYNIRISSTQSYLDDNVRGRFNGVFMMITLFGQILGQLSAGILAEYFPSKYIVLVAFVIDLIVILLTMLPNREHVKKIYNQEL